MANINTAWDQVSNNTFKTWIIMFLFSLFTVGVIYVIAQGFGYGEVGGLGITGFALILAGIMNFVSYYWSDKIVLGISGAKPVEKKDNPEIYRLVENLCIAAGLPLPKIYILEDTAPNAFATGRDPKHGVICFTTGIIQKLEKTELEGVIAHELSHIGNRDILLSTVVVVLVGFITLLADWFRHWSFGRRGSDREGGGQLQLILFILAIVLSILAPFAAMLMQLAISRKREFLADASGALLTRYPDGLARDLEKISSDPTPMRVTNDVASSLFIDSPYKGKQKTLWFAKLFMTHPPIEERIRALRGMDIDTIV